MNHFSFRLQGSFHFLIALLALVLPPRMIVSCDEYSWCQDSTEMFKVGISPGTIEEKNCEWIKSHSPTTRCKYDNAVRAKCPKTCNACSCKNNPNLFQVHSSDSNADNKIVEMKDCNWVRENPSWKCGPDYDGALINCPFTCGLCTEETYGDSIMISSRNTGSSRFYIEPSRELEAASYCSIEEALGKTYFLKVQGLCAKVELFLLGRIGLDGNNPDCVVISNNIKDGKVMKKNRIVSFDNDEVNEGKRETKEEKRIMNSTKMTHEVQSDIIGSISNKGRATNYIKENEMEKNKFQDEKNER